MKEDTKLASLGRAPDPHAGAVNIPVYRMSTAVFESVSAMEAAMAARLRNEDATVYGTTGTPSSFALQNALADLEDGYRCLLYPSGLAAVVAPLMGLLSQGDHLLMTDSVYGPTRQFCDGMLKRFGVETTYFDPLIGADLKSIMRPNTRAVFLESPGSYSFEIQDTPLLASIAHDAGAKVLMDNTWASPLFHKPLSLGVDVSIQAATKYIVGHADVLMGAVTTNAETWPLVRDATWMLGQCVGGDDIYLALRGLRTMKVRLERHQSSAIKVADWLMTRKEVARVLHPALPYDPGHAIWRRDFTGSTGLFGVELQPAPKKAVNALLDGLKLFGLGFSWGGYESLAIEGRPPRSVTPWRGGPLLRLHIGLEDPDDLIEDLKSGFELFNQNV